MNDWGPDDVTLYPLGVGNEAARLSLKYGSNPGEGSFKREGGTDAGSVEIVTLDSIAEERRWLSDSVQITLMKVDVEGGDPEVIFGAPRLLQSGLVKNIFVEFSNKNADRTNYAKMAEDLFLYGYKIEVMGNWKGGEEEEVVLCFFDGPSSILNQFAHDLLSLVACSHDERLARIFPNSSRQECFRARVGRVRILQRP